MIPTTFSLLVTQSDTYSTCDTQASIEEHVTNYHLVFSLLKSELSKAKPSENVTYPSTDLQQTMLLSGLSKYKALYSRAIWLYSFGIIILAKKINKNAFFVHKQTTRLQEIFIYNMAGFMY